jgi:hypothetical protein
MNTLIGLGCGIIALALFLGLARELLVWVHHDGYKQGWEAAEEWIVTVETEVDQARQKIWKEEGEKRWP